MQDMETCVAVDQCVEVGTGKSSAQQLQDLLTRGLPSLYRRAYRLLGNAADAEDAVQDALLAAHRHLHQFKGNSQMSTWLNAIVANCARTQLRKRPRHLHVSLDSSISREQEYSLSDTLEDCRPTPEDTYQNSELNARLRKSAAKLSPALRKTFHLRHMDDLSICETARALGVPIGTANAQLVQARSKLRRSMRSIYKPQARARRRMRAS